jgi:hypothetical protein
MTIRRPTLVLAVLAGALFFAACKKDANLKATKTDCDDACTHATALNSGKQDAFAKRCPTICLEKEWSVGDTRCINDAKTYDDAENCGAVAKALLDLKEGRAGRHGRNRRHRGRHKGQGQGQGQGQDDQQDQGDEAPEQK